MPGFRFSLLALSFSAIQVLFNAQAATYSDGCVLQTSVNMPTYRASQSAQGELVVRVRCGAAAGPYQLTLTGAQMTGIGDATFAVGADRSLLLTLLDAAPVLTGQTLQGDLDRRFTLQLPAGQWRALAGKHLLRLDLTLTPAGR